MRFLNSEIEKTKPTGNVAAKLFLSISVRENELLSLLFAFYYLVSLSSFVKNKK